MPIHTPEHAISFADEPNWYVFVRSGDVGRRIGLGTYENIHAIDEQLEGPARPACYFAYDPDDLGGSSENTNAGSNTRYHGVNNADYMEWTVPVGFSGLDRLIVNYVGLTTGDVAVFKRNGVSVGTLDTVNGSTDYRLTSTVTLSTPLATGDVLRVEAQAGGSDPVLIGSLIAYDADGIADAGQSFVVPDAPATQPTKSVEFAHRIAPTGQATRWIGGASHQGNPDNCIEVNPVDSWTKDGEAWSPVVGWNDGTFVLSRTSDVEHTEGGDVVATLAYSYTFRDSTYSVDHTLTASEDLDVNTAYVAMATSRPEANVSIESDGTQASLNVSPGTTINHSASTTSIGLFDTHEGQQATLALDRSTSSPSSVFTLFHSGGTYKKTYYRILPTSTSGSSWGGGWTMTFGRPSNVTTLGLANHWKLDGDLTDSVGSNDGSWVAATAPSPTYAAGKIGQSIDLLGSDSQRVNIGTNNLTGDRTLAAWVYLTSIPGQIGIVSLGEGWLEGSALFLRDAAGYQIAAGFHKDSNGRAYFKRAGNLPLDQWVHLAATFTESDASIALYMNGSLITDTAQTGNSSQTRVAGGSIGWVEDVAAPEYFTGQIDDVRVYSRALSADDVAALYTQASSSSTLRRGRYFVGLGMGIGL